VNRAVIEDNQRIDLEVCEVEIYVHRVQPDEEVGKDLLLVCWDFTKEGRL
jgi:hypothetical protein